jgi:hypothetical protein
VVDRLVESANITEDLMRETMRLEVMPDATSVQFWRVLGAATRR